MSIIELLRSLGALAITLGLLLGLAWALKRYGLLGNFGQKTASPSRLKIVENLWLDAGKTRMLIVSCDGVEKLILIGPNGANELGQINSSALQGTKK
ncbi:MAG: hypothetical protein FD163_1947 [Hyphomonadaceae bacterium]|nr:MAG: hypothetical protein FD163_1947 [Hyphomonadaceae bacterium]